MTEALTYEEFTSKIQKHFRGGKSPEVYHSRDILTVTDRYSVNSSMICFCCNYFLWIVTFCKRRMLFWKWTLRMWLDNPLVWALGSMLPLIKVKPCANHVSDGFRVMCLPMLWVVFNVWISCRRTFQKERALKQENITYIFKASLKIFRKMLYCFFDLFSSFL